MVDRGDEISVNDDILNYNEKKSKKLIANCNEIADSTDSDRPESEVTLPKQCELIITVLMKSSDGNTSYQESTAEKQRELWLESDHRCESDSLGNCGKPEETD